MALTTWYQALLNRRSIPAVVCCIGDDTTEGQAGVNRAGADGWQYHLRNWMRVRYPGGGDGEGWNPPGSYGVASDWTPTSVSADLTRGMSQRGVTIAPSGKLSRSGVTGTVLKIRYATLSGGGTLRVKVDTVIVATQSTNATASEGNVLSVSLAAGSHTIDIENSAVSGNVQVSNIGLFNGEETAGIQWSGHGHAGFKVSDFLAAEGGSGPLEIAEINPHLVTIQLGINEKLTSVSVATFQTNLGTLVDRIRGMCTTNPSILLIINWSQPGWAAYAWAISAVATAKSCDVIDLRNYMTVQQQSPIFELYGSGGGYHPSDSGYKVIADALLDVVAPREMWSQMVSGQETIRTLSGVIATGVSISAEVADIPGRADLTQAAVVNGWGTPTFSDDFLGATLGASWTAPNTPGHVGNGLRRATQVTVANSILTLTGLPNGTTGYVARFGSARTHGRWEARMRVPSGGADQYHPVMLLWPESDNWPAEGEIDWCEAHSCNSLIIEHNLHYNSGGDVWSTGQRTIDISKWHNYAVDWTSTAVRGYIDGTLFYENTTLAQVPPAPMYPAIQLDWFPDTGTTLQSTMLVDWWREYAP